MPSKVTEVVEKWKAKLPQENPSMVSMAIPLFARELLKAVDVELEHVCHDNRCGGHMESLISDIK